MLFTALFARSKAKLMILAGMEKDDFGRDGEGYPCVIQIVVRIT